MAARVRRIAPERSIVWLVPAAVVGFVLWQLYPEYLFRDTTPVHGDLAGHVLGPPRLRDHLLHGRLTGWSQAWFTGFPTLTFYFPLPNLVIVLLDTVLPYHVAVKLMVAVGPMTLPLAAYAFGRLNRRTPLTSVCYAVAALVVVLQPTLYMMGGSIWSAALGEFAYGLSISLALLALGLAGAGLRTGRYRVLTAAVLAAAVVSHLVPAATALIGVVALTLQRPSRAKLRWTANVLATTAALVGVWLVPLLARLDLTSRPDVFERDSLSHWLLPTEMAPVVVLASVALVLMVAASVVLGARQWDDTESFLVTMAVASALLVALLPDRGVPSTRFLSCWFLWVSLFAFHCLARLAGLVDEAREKAARGRRLDSPRMAQLAMPVVVLIAVLPLWDSRLAGGLLSSKWDTTEFAKLYLSGYEESSHRAEFASYIDTVRSVGRTHGCGRAHVEWAQNLWADFRTFFTWMTPYWTDGCITTATGLLVQSSATTPYIDTTNKRLSSDAMPLWTDRRSPDLQAGVADLRLLGIRYFLASYPDTQRAADASPDLRLVAETEPFSDMRWKVYEIPDVTVVEPLRYEPVVVATPAGSWERAARRWYDSGPAREVVVAADGPERWPRADRMSGDLPRRPVPDATVGNVDIDDERITFDVSRTGTPVLVKVSYFPNWRVEGADGPWRATPNHMVVVPRSRTVTLRYGRTFPDNLGAAVSLAGVGGLVFLGTRPAVEMPVPREPGAAAAESRSRTVRRPKGKKRRR
jgi:hypothetical protein